VPRRHYSDLKDDDAAEVACAEENAMYLWYINARFFVEEMLPTDQNRKDLKEHVATLMASTLEGFQVSTFMRQRN
jgi:hypothetical protein